MNFSKILNLVLAVTMLVLIIKFSPSTNTSKDTATQEETMSTREAVLSTIQNRKSVRHFTDKKISKEDMTAVLKAGMAAPTGFDARPWKFIVIRDTAMMNKMRKGLVYARGLDQSTAAIVVCGDMTKVHKSDPEFWITDTSAATENILLALESMGLGGVWSTVYPSEKRMAFVSNLLGLPESILPLNVIPVGYPAGIEKAKDKFDPTNIHYEKWSQ